MKSLHEEIDEFAAGDDDYPSTTTDSERRDSMQKALDEGCWEGLSKFCGCDMKPMRLKIKEAHAAGRI